MVIASINVKTVSRGKGRSAVAAYRSGEKLRNEREGNTYGTTTLNGGQG